MSMSYGCIHMPYSNQVCWSCREEQDDMIEPIAQRMRLRWAADPEWRDDIIEIGKQLAGKRAENWASEAQRMREDEGVTESELRLLDGNR